MLFSDSDYQEINASTEKVIVLPLGAIEQHGPHLAVAVDTDIISAIAAAAEKQLPEDIVLCPALPFGSSHHHLSFGGTFSIQSSTYIQVITGLVECALHNGFRRIVLMNGHGGNIVPVKQALTELSNRYDSLYQPNIALITYWELAAAAFSGSQVMESRELSHACEYETSLMLHLFPKKVFTDRIQRARFPAGSDFICWESERPYAGVSMVKQTAFISSNGGSGEPQLATAEKGEYLFNHAVEKLVAFLRAFGSWPLLQNLSS